MWEVRQSCTGTELCCSMKITASNWSARSWTQDKLGKHSHESYWSSLGLGSVTEAEKSLPAARQTRHNCNLLSELLFRSLGVSSLLKIGLAQCCLLQNAHRCRPAHVGLCLSTLSSTLTEKQSWILFLCKLSRQLAAVLMAIQS